MPMDADRSLRQSRHQIHPPSLHLGPLRDPHDDRLQSNHVPYDMTVPPPFMHLSHNSFPIFDQLYPSSPIPPLLQIHHQHTHPQIRSGATFISFPSVAGALPLQPTPYQAMTSPPPWHPSQHPYYHIPPPLPPPPIPHKVWILDCKSCGMFLTNRGMKVSEFLPKHSNLSRPLKGSTSICPFCVSANSSPGCLVDRPSTGGPVIRAMNSNTMRAWCHPTYFSIGEKGANEPLLCTC